MLELNSLQLGGVENKQESKEGVWETVNQYKENILEKIDKDYIDKIVTPNVWQYKGFLLKLLDVKEDGICLLDSGEDWIIEIHIDDLTTLKSYSKIKDRDLENLKLKKHYIDNVVPLNRNKKNEDYLNIDSWENERMAS